MAENRKPATPDGVAEALAFALRYSGRKRGPDLSEIIAAIVAERLVEPLDRCGARRLHDGAET